MPVDISTNGALAGKTVVQISAGSYHTCALTSDGGIYCWGDNSNYGQLGNGSTTNSAVPVAVDTSGVLAGKTVTQISTGYYHTCALTSNGGTYCWGNNNYGQLGNGNQTKANVPVAVDNSGVLAGKTVTQVSAGGFHTCVLTNDGRAYCWGNNHISADSFGQLGNGGSTDSSVPVAVDISGVLAGKTLTQISSGGYHTCAVTSDGRTYCWGWNRYGGLGNGSTTAANVPVAVDTSGVLAGKTVTQVSAAIHHTCAQTGDGKSYCWGYNNYGQLGNGSTTDTSLPVAVDTSGVLVGKTVTQVGAGSIHTCVLTNDGWVYCWGNNYIAQLGNGIPSSFSNPQTLLSGGALAGKTVTQVSAGSLYTCALTSDSGIYCWGPNPVAVDTSGVLAGKTVTQVSAGGGHTCVLTSEGRSYCWGSAPGNGSWQDSSVPVAVNTSGALWGKTVTQISAGDDHTCVLTSEGRSYCWGFNNFGQLGNGSTADKSVPVAVDTSGVLAGKTVTQVSAGGGHTCVLTSEGRSYCWGFNNFGQLGNASTTSSNVPVAVGISGGLTGKRVTQISAGSQHTCALTSEGSTYCWGRNSAGQLGNGSTTAANVPVAVDTSGVLVGKTVTQLSAGDWYTCALTNEGRTYCWGQNATGQLGNGELTNATSHSTVPVAVATDGVLAGQRVVQVSAGGYHTAIITAANVPNGLNAVLTVADKSYDGATTATLTRCLLFPVTAGVSCDFNPATARFADANIGSGRPVTVSDLALTGGGDAYVLTAPTFYAVASIEPARLTASVTAAAKPYDGNTTATISACSLAGVVPGETVTCSATAATFADANAGNGKLVTATGIALAGANVANYVLGSTMATTTANITKATQAALTVTANPPNLTSGGPGSTLSANGGSTGGSVTYAATGTAGLTCSITGNTLTATGGAGSCSVTATMAGNANYLPVTSAALAVPVTAGVEPSGLFAAVLPYARSVQVGQPATAFGTLINATGVNVTNCYVALPAGLGIPSTFNYQTTNASNQLVGTPNTPVNIPAGGSQSFVFGITPSAAFAATDIPLVFDCANTQPAPSQTGLNTFLLSASSTPVPDMIAISATPTGDGVLRIPGSNGVHAFGTAAVNIGGAGEITATVDTGGVSLPLTLTICQTNPGTGACLSQPASSTTSTLANNASATYAVFAQAGGAIPFDPAGKRIFLRLASGGVVRGATSVAVTTE